MEQQYTPQAFSFGVLNPRLGHFTPELPKPADWDELLVKLSLNDVQALEAVKADGEASEQLRDFVVKFCAHHFVPEAVISVVLRRRKEKRRAMSSASRGMTINTNDTAAFGEQE